MFTARLRGTVALTSMFAWLCSAAVETRGQSIFTDQTAFESAVSGTGKLLKFVENFEESNVGAGQIAIIAEPLEPGIPNVDGSGLGFPFGLLANNIELTSSSGSGLAVLGDGFAGNATVKVGANIFADTLIVSVLPGLPDKTAIGFNIEDPIGGTGDYDLTIRDTNGGILFAGVVSAGAAPGSFIGIVSKGPALGSISVGGSGSGGELLDNIQLWEVPPCDLPGDVDGDGDVDVSDLGALLANFGQVCD